MTVKKELQPLTDAEVDALAKDLSPADQKQLRSALVWMKIMTADGAHATAALNAWNRSKRVAENEHESES